MTLSPDESVNDVASFRGAGLPTAAPDRGRFVITLCDTAAPVSIPRAHLAYLNRFHFFGPGMRGGGPPYRVHMGYFLRRADAEKWLKVLLPAYPYATVRELPITQPDTLTDSQVVRTLGERRTGNRGSDSDEPRARAIPLLAPEETAVRRALRDAVHSGAPVSFAVQLQCSAQPIDLQEAVWDPIFRFYTLYTTRARYDGRDWSCLRLGFFSDALAAKQVALYLRSSYGSAAVLPVGADEKGVAPK